MGVSLSIEVLREYGIIQLVELLENVEKLYNETAHDGVLEETNKDFALTYNLVEEVLIEKGYYNIPPVEPDTTEIWGRVCKTCRCVSSVPLTRNVCLPCQQKTWLDGLTG